MIALLETDKALQSKPFTAQLRQKTNIDYPEITRKMWPKSAKSAANGVRARFISCFLFWEKIIFCDGVIVADGLSHMHNLLGHFHFDADGKDF